MELVTSGGWFDLDLCLVLFVLLTHCHDTLSDAEKSKYKLLCKDGTTAPIDSYASCHLAKVPGHAVVTRKDPATVERIKTRLTAVGDVRMWLVHPSALTYHEALRENRSIHCTITNGCLVVVFFRASISSLLQPTHLPKTSCSRTLQRGCSQCPQAQTPSCIWVLSTWAWSVPWREVLHMADLFF